MTFAEIKSANDLEAVPLSGYPEVLKRQYEYFSPDPLGKPLRELKRKHTSVVPIWYMSFQEKFLLQRRSIPRLNVNNQLAVLKTVFPPYHASQLVLSRYKLPSEAIGIRLERELIPGPFSKFSLVEREYCIFDDGNDAGGKLFHATKVVKQTDGGLVLQDDLIDGTYIEPIPLTDQLCEYALDRNGLIYEENFPINFGIYHLIEKGQFPSVAQC